MASKDKIFLDTDVALDHLADRQPFAEYAHRLLALANLSVRFRFYRQRSFWRSAKQPQTEKLSYEVARVCSTIAAIVSSALPSKRLFT